MVGLKTKQLEQGVRSANLPIGKVSQPQAVIGNKRVPMKDISTVPKRNRSRGTKIEPREEIKLRAERKAGEMLAETELDKGGRPAENQSHDASSLPKLKELGIEKDQSSRWQNIASIPEETFEEHIKKVINSKKELTSVSVYNLARNQ